MASDILTDDLGLSAEFLADEDIARDVDEYDAWHEAKPHGWGIERFEDPALAQANAAMGSRIDARGDCKYTSAICGIETSGMYAGCWSGPRPTNGDHVFRDLCWLFWSRQSARRLRHSRIVWERICDEAETHQEAVERYTRWAERAVTVRYRDE